MGTDSIFEQAQNLLSNGKFAEAEEACDRVLGLDQQHVRANHMRGTLHLMRSRPEAALPFLQRSSDLGNTHQMLPLHLGLACAGTGRHEDAVHHFQEAVRSNPELPDAALNLGLALFATGKPKESLDAFQNAARLSPDNPTIHGAWGNAFMELDRPLEALAQFDLALAATPGSVTLLNNKALALLKVGEPAQALSYLWRANEIEPENEEVATNLTDCLRDQDDNVMALEGLQKLAGRLGENAHVSGSLAYCLERANQCDDALLQAEDTLALEPSSFLALITLARCERRAGRFPEALAWLEQLSSTDITEKQRTIILKEKGQILDRQGDYNSAFEAFSAANEIASGLEMENRTHTTIFDSITAAQAWAESGERQTSPRPPQATSHVHPNPSEPVFFVGFPRSGTTLLEVILKAHPRFVTAGERAWILMTMRQSGFTSPDQWDSMTEEDVAKARDYYWSLARRVHGENLSQHRLLDKMPFNIVHLGFINRIFPRAKILTAIRDPRDCVVSGFMQNFSRVPELEPFLRLDTGARYYADIMGLWLKYREVLPIDFMEYKYESLTNDPKSTLERILAHLDEPWDDAVLHHQRNNTTDVVIRTPSARDVTEGVYRRATQRWQNYAEQISPVEEILRPFLDAFGYD